MNHLAVVGLAGLAALLLAALLTPPVLWLAKRLGAVDSPGVRRMHQQTIPRLGGLAIVGAYGAVLALELANHLVPGVEESIPRLRAFLVGGLVIAITGALDDLRGIGAKSKLLGQVLAATIAWAFEVRVQPTVDLPFLGVVDFGIAFSYVATVIWILAITNAINLIDGLDGLAGGVVFFAAVTNAIVAIVTDNALGALLNAVLAGAVLGFLFFNFNPARIFMGDTGSLFLGYALAAGALMTSRQKESTIASLLVPLVALGLPVTDTLLAMARRVIARRSIFSADREHVHHRLVDLGVTHRRAVLILYACSVALCAVSVALALGKDWQVGFALSGAAVVVVGIVRFAGSFGRAFERRRHREHLYDGATAALGDGLPDFVLGLRQAANLDEALRCFDQLLPVEFFPTVRVARASDRSLVWERGTSTERSRTDRTRTETPVRALDYFASLGGGRVVVVVGYQSQGGQVPPQVDVLLRVAVDTLERSMQARESGRSTWPVKGIAGG